MFPSPASERPPSCRCSHSGVPWHHGRDLRTAPGTSRCSSSPSSSPCSPSGNTAPTSSDSAPAPNTASSRKSNDRRPGNSSATSHEPTHLRRHSRRGLPRHGARQTPLARNSSPSCSSPSTPNAWKASTATTAIPKYLTDIDLAPNVRATMDHREALAMPLVIFAVPTWASARKPKNSPPSACRPTPRCCPAPKASNATPASA